MKHLLPALLLTPLLCIALPRLAHAEEGVIPAPLPRDEGLAPEGEAKLPIRLTVTWNVATRQAKCYVGQSFCGILGQGGLKRSKAKVKQVIAAGTTQAEIDADGLLPWPLFLKAFNDMRECGLDAISFAAPQQMPKSRFMGPPPASLDTWHWPMLPKVDRSERALPDSAKALLVAIDHDGHFAVCKAVQSEPKALAGPHFSKWLKVQAALEKDPKNAQLSNRKLVFRMAAEAQWRDLMVPLIECARAGVWDLYFAVDAPRSLTITVGPDGSFTLDDVTFTPDAAGALEAALAEQVKSAGGASEVRLRITGSPDAKLAALETVEKIAAKLGIERRATELGK